MLFSILISRNFHFKSLVVSSSNPEVLQRKQFLLCKEQKIVIAFIHTTEKDGSNQSIILLTWKAFFPLNLIFLLIILEFQEMHIWFLFLLGPPVHHGASPHQTPTKSNLYCPYSFMGKLSVANPLKKAKFPPTPPPEAKDCEEHLSHNV